MFFTCQLYLNTAGKEHGLVGELFKYSTWFGLGRLEKEIFLNIYLIIIIILFHYRTTTSKSESELIHKEWTFLIWMTLLTGTLEPAVCDSSHTKSGSGTRVLEVTWDLHHGFPGPSLTNHPAPSYKLRDSWCPLMWSVNNNDEHFAKLLKKRLRSFIKVLGQQTTE